MSKQPNGPTASVSLSYKYQRVRERLRRDVEGGVLSGKLPGERELSKRYGTNAKTINKALTDLATEGLLVRHVGRGTFVSGDGSAETRRRPTGRMNFGYAIPADSAGPWAQELFRRTAAVLQVLGHHFEQFAVPADASVELCGRRLSADRLRALDGLALFGLHPSAALLASAAREHLPLVMVGNRHEQVRTAAVVVDYAQGAFELCQHLIHLGHVAIRLCIDPALLPAASAAELGYRAAMLRNDLEPRPVCPAECIWSAEETAPPTAVLCVGALTAAAVSKAASAQSVRPVSLGCIPEPADTTPARQRLTSYEVDAGQLARWIAELLISASPTCREKVVIVPGTIVERGSTLPAAGPASALTKPQVAEL